MGSKLMYSYKVQKCVFASVAKQSRFYNVLLNQDCFVASLLYAMLGLMIVQQMHDQTDEEAVTSEVMVRTEEW